MISEYLAAVAQREVSSEHGVQAQAEIIAAFDASLDSLQDPTIVNSPRVNFVATVMGSLLAANQFDVRVWPSPSGGAYRGTQFQVGASHSSYPRGCLHLASDYHQRVKADPVLELGSMVQLAEAIRGRIQPNKVHPGVFAIRGQALAAELLHGIVAEEPKLHIHDGQQRLMAQHPRGFEDLRPEYTYTGAGVMPLPAGLTPEEVGEVAVLEASTHFYPPALHDMLAHGKGRWSFARLEALLQAVSSPLHFRVDGRSARIAIEWQDSMPPRRSKVAQHNMAELHMQNLRKLAVLCSTRGAQP
jgi:hypothetical protein